jgi:ribonuclease HI
MWQGTEKDLIHIIVFLVETFTNVVCAIDYKRQEIFSDKQAHMQALEASRIMLKLVWECQKTLCAQSHRNVAILWVPGHSRIQDNKNASHLARHGSKNKFLCPEPTVPFPTCAGRL